MDYLNVKTHQQQYDACQDHQGAPDFSVHLPVKYGSTISAPASLGIPVSQPKAPSTPPNQSQHTQPCSTPPTSKTRQSKQPQPSIVPSTSKTHKSQHDPTCKTVAAPNIKISQPAPPIISSQSGPPQPMTGAIIPWQLQASGDNKSMYSGSDIPSQDLPEDYTVPEPGIIPPDVSRYQPVHGYEGIGYHSDGTAPPIPPPRHDKVTRREQPAETFSSVPDISDAQARDALLSYTAQHCCYGRAAARQMEICKITSSSALNYTLESFVETRSTSWQQEPYKGETVDSAGNGSPPTPWLLTARPSQPFTGEVQCFEVPHTAFVVNCHACDGRGFTRCHNCCGRGFKRCISCNGSGRSWETDAHGHRQYKACWRCHGTGRKRCFTCSGEGCIVCNTCQGFRQMKSYIKLTVKFTNNLSEHVIEKTELPENMLKNVAGVTIFEQTLPRVWPITSYPDRELCINSQRLVNDHGHKFNHSRILTQRQVLRVVPVAECIFKWKERKDRFWVYGDEHAVHAPTYPQRCCWGCIIL